MSSKNNIENRGETQIKICSTCKDVIKPVQVIKSGKGRMIDVCGCGFAVNSRADINHLL
jgi:hypothetical protein